MWISCFPKILQCIQWPRMCIHHGLFLAWLMPHLRLLQVDQSRRICDGVAAGELDVAIIGGEVPDDLQSALKAVTYAEDQLVCCCYIYTS